MAFDFGKLEEKLEITEIKDEKIKPKYVSKEGFETVPVRRGFTEISSIWSLLFLDIKWSNCIFCGGYVRYMCSTHINPAKPGDLDIYFKNEDYFNEAKDKMKIVGFEINHENNICISFKLIDDIESNYFGTPEIQLIKPMLDGSIVSVGTMEEILSNFDFTVVRAGLLSPTKAMVDADFIHDESKRILRLKNIHCPISSTLRCMKYSRKGYWLPPLQCCRLFLDWEDRDEDYRQKILDFLTEADKGEGLTKKDIDEMERLMRID